MKEGTAYARRVKQAFSAQRKKSKPIDPPAFADLVECLAIGVLSRGMGIDRARRAMGRALEVMAGWNEVRVSTPVEVIRDAGSGLTGREDDVRRMIQALDSVYDREHILSLERLRSIGRREAKQFLEGLSEVDEHAQAFVLLWGLGAHAIPVDDSLLSALHRGDLVHPEATRGEIQSFLERNISAAKGQEFVLVMSDFSPPASKKKPASAKKSKKKAKASGTSKKSAKRDAAKAKGATKKAKKTTRKKKKLSA